MVTGQTKLLVSTSVLLVSVSVIGFRWQEPLLSIPAVVALLLLAIWIGRPSPVVGLGVSLLFLYPASQTGWLYARGGHVAARSTAEIASSGWPTTIDLVRGFTETPGIHFLALITARLTDLSILPSKTGQLLASALIGILSGAIALLLTGILIRRYHREISQYVSLPPLAYLLLSVIAWIPFFQQRIVFARRSLAIALFAMFVYSLFRFLSITAMKYKVLVLLSGLAIIPIHHLTAVVTIVLIGLAGLWVKTQPIKVVFGPQRGITQSKLLGPQLAGITLIFTTVFFFWQLIATGGISKFLSIFAGTAALSDKIGAILLFFGPTQQPPGLPPVSPGWLVRYQVFFGVWIFLAIVGGLTVLTAIIFSRRQSNEEWARFSAIAGVLFGIATVATWITGFGSRTRIATFFVLIGAWLAPLGGWLLAQDHGVSRFLVTKSIVAIVIILGVALVPTYVVGWGGPPYDQGVTDQRFPSSYYAGGEFINRFTAPDRLIVGDENAEHILIATAGRIARNDPSPVIAGKKPEGSIVMLFAYNDQYYFGATSEGERYRTSPVQPLNISSRSSKPYSNGEVVLYD